MGFALPAIAMAPGPAAAHFLELIPSVDIVSAGDGRTLEFEVRFTHPMARGPVMDMGPPTVFGLLLGGARRDLSAALALRTVDGRAAYAARYTLTGPGDHVFFLEPAPYWEPAEGKMIVHFAKVVVDGFGAGGGWAAAVGFPVEIEPLTRPYGLWTGNAFQGVVRRGGQPVPFAEVEVEWRNDGSVTPPSDAFLTQVVRADGAGVFTYVMPRAGWWGFAALVDGDTTMRNPDGREVPVEWGGLLWVKTVDMK